MGASDIAAARADGGLSTLLLVHADPLRTHPGRGTWERALAEAGTVIAFADFLDGGIAEHADVIFPAESYAERDGTMTHPDGRVQRLRQSIGHPGEVRPVWWALAQIAARLGSKLELPSSPAVSDHVFKAVPFYEGLTLEEIGGTGVRWQERTAASNVPAAEAPDTQLGTAPEPADGLKLGTRPSLWTGREVTHAPVLQFLRADQTVELSPADAQRLGVHQDSRVNVSMNGTRVGATVALRAAMPEGSAFLIEGTDSDNGTALPMGAVVEVRPA
jgi:NADH-quinone oxidoreductase subunit G